MRQLCVLLANLLELSLQSGELDHMAEVVFVPILEPTLTCCVLCLTASGWLEAPHRHLLAVVVEVWRWNEEITSKCRILLFKPSISIFTS